MASLRLWLAQKSSPKPRRIVRAAPTPWKTRLILLVSIFGGLWLFAEPLLAFGVGAGLFQSLGFGGYAALFCLSVISTFAADYFKSVRAGGSMTFVRLKVVLTQDGTTHLIEVPEEMLVRVFLELFLKDVARAGSNPLVARWDMFETTLLVERPRDSGEFVPVSKHKTVKEVGLRDDDVCRLQGKVATPAVLFSH